MPSAEGDNSNLEQALLDPASVFDCPEDVVTRGDIAEEIRIEILRRWEYDAKEIEVSEEEGMTDGHDSLLDRILRALHKLGAGPDVAHSAPTKQGGI